MKNVLNKKEARVRCPAEANKSRSADISITRRSGSKAREKVKNAATWKSGYRIVDRWSLISGAFIMYRDIFRRVFPSPSLFPVPSMHVSAYLPYRAYARRRGSQSAQEKGERCRQERKGGRGKMRRKRSEDVVAASDNKKEYDPIWARARRHSNGRERSLFII